MTLTRPTAVALGALAALLGWTVATQLAGAALEVNAVPVAFFEPVMAALVTGLLGWGLLTVLQRSSRTRTAAARTWTAVAVGFAALSLLGPALVPGIATEDRVWLAVLHVLVAAAYIPLMRRSLPATA